MVQSMFGFADIGAVNMQASEQTYLWMGLAALAAFLLPNTKEISERFQDNIAKRKTKTLYGFGVLSGFAAAFAFLASLSLIQSPFLYFNF